MKVLDSWLREFVPALDLAPDAVGDVLSSLGLCCDEVIHLRAPSELIVVARVLSLSPHPDADKIQLVDVDAGAGVALQICCGAFNMAVGDLVPLAKIGAVMPDGMEIARRKLRGEWSNGMLCSARELGFGDDHAGIMILDGVAHDDVAVGEGGSGDRAEPGARLASVLDLADDAVYDLDLTPNRPDALSVLGVARDLAAKLGLPLVVPDIDVAESGAPTGELLDVEIAAPDLCGRFTARVLSGIATDAVTPRRLARRLTLCGMRPISAIVDISNYVMLEYGQPNHTFDLDTLAGAGAPDRPVRLGVRRSRDGESVETLDGVRRDLVDGDGVIVDADDVAISIAGVMGGASSEISDRTTRIVLEMAWWDPPSIGRTSKRLGLRSEAGNRFERGVDPEIAELAARRFAQLATEVCGAHLHPGSVVRDGELPHVAVARVRPARVNALLATSLSADQIATLLAPIGFVSVPVEGSPDSGSVPDAALDVTIPTWRPDSTAEIDVVEEVARLYGFDRLGKTVPVSPHWGRLSEHQRRVRTVRTLLVGAGFTEVMPNPFLAPEDLDRCGLPDEGVRIVNPLVSDESILRTSTMPGIIKTIAANAAHRQHGVRFFEIGHCYARSADPGALPDEWEELAVAVAGAQAPEAVRTLRGVLGALGIGDVRLRADGIEGLHPSRASLVLVGDVVIGEVGEIDPSVLEAHGVAERVAWISLRLDEVVGLAPAKPQTGRISRFPTADVDLAFVVDDATPVDVVIDALRSADPLVVSVRLFDVYRGDQLGPGRRSLAFAVRLQARDRTLSDADVSAARSACVAAAGDSVGATLRTG